MEFTPGWSVGWFFVPIMNLFKPYQAVREIYHASDPEADAESWRQPEAPSFITMWWGLWIITNILGNFEMRTVFSDDQGTLIAGAWLGAFNSLLAIPATLLALRVVKEIHGRQESKATVARMS
ncbi:MAG: DUF4328 domain-containing protein [bacterium]|nr:DUF4328 domain-containing protein [bacterium]